MKKKKITIRDIADKLDVTASTVSRALKNHPRISDATKKAVVEMADKLNYQPNNIASALRKGKSNIIGVIIPTSDRRFFASVIKGIEQILREEGYSLIISQSDDIASKEQSNIEALLRVQVDGIIASIARETTDYSHFERAINRGVPLILFDRVNEELGVNTVVNDDYQGGSMATNHLIEQGCTKIAHFMGKKHLNIYQERLRGYKDALKEHNIPINEDWILEGDLIDETEHVLETGRQLTHKLFEGDDVPDAIFSSSDFAAMGAIQVLKEKNIKIPDEVALVGFSNDLTTSFIDPPLTSIDQHTRQMGELAAQVFLQQIDSNSKNIPFDTTLKPELIIRASSMRKEKVKAEQQAL